MEMWTGSPSCFSQRRPIEVRSDLLPGIQTIVNIDICRNGDALDFSVLMPWLSATLPQSSLLTGRGDKDKQRLLGLNLCGDSPDTDRIGILRLRSGRIYSRDPRPNRIRECRASRHTFLDEIGDLPLELQPRLLRVLQSGEFTRLGSVCSETVDVRFITTTNRDLVRETEEGRFRSDLYYRLSAITLKIPPFL